MWIDFKNIRSRELGEDLQAKYQLVKQRLVDRGLGCAYDCKRGRNFAFVTAALINPLFREVHKRDLRHPSICRAEMALFVRNGDDKLVSALTVGFRFNNPMRRMALPTLNNLYTFSWRFYKDLGVVVELQCTDEAHKTAEFLRLELEALELCIHDILMRDEPETFSLNTLFRAVLHDPSVSEMVMLVVVCPNTDLARINQLVEIGLKRSRRDWGVDQAFQTALEREIVSSFSPMSPAV
jgi:hypothetical protein